MLRINSKNKGILNNCCFKNIFLIFEPIEVFLSNEKERDIVMNK